MERETNCVAGEPNLISISTSFYWATLAKAENANLFSLRAKNTEKNYEIIMNFAEHVGPEGW
jgi:hypothetical protein